MPSAYDAVSGFSATQDSSSQWRFGYYPPNSTGFIPYSTYNASAYPNIDTWSSTSAGVTPPLVFHNKTTTTQTYSSVTQPADVLNLHPGPSGEKSVVRWTSPFAGTVAIKGRFQGLDYQGATTDVSIKWSGAAQPLFSSFLGLNGQSQTTAYSLTATVAVGDTIDFIVGYGNGYYGADSTGLAASIVKTAYDIVPDYSATQNPVGPWSYGYTASPTATTFVPYAAHAASPPAGTDTWVRDAPGLTPPMVIHNNTGVAPTSWTGAPPPDLLNLHPGAVGEKSVVRWTAPFAGTISIAGRFTGLDPVGDSVDVTVKWSGAAQPLFSSYVGIANQGYNIPYSVTATVAAGDTIDFLVGYGNGYYYNDSTGLAGKISFTSYPQPVAPPNAPTLSATPGNAQVSLSWNAVNTATSYTVRRSVNGAPSVIVASNLAGTSYTDTGLTNGTTYSYIVQAVNAGGGGAFSSPVNATPLAPPATPSGLSATPGNVQVSLGWTASTGASAYGLKRATASAGPYTTLTTSLTGTSYTDTGLTNGTTYYYTVFASNTSGTSSDTTLVSATPLATPDTPVSLTASAGNAQVQLSWTPSARATGYSVNRATISGGPYTSVATGVTASSYTDTGLVNGTTYYYVVSATGVGGESPNSLQVSATPVAAPTAPSGLSATAGNAQVSLGWNAVGGATTYQVFRSTTDGTFSSTPLATTTATTYSDTSVTNGTTYYYIVKASNAGGTSPASAQVSATPVAAPVAPAGLAATPGNAQIALSWNAATGATGYKLFRSTTSGTYSATPLAVLGSVSSYSDTSVSNGTTYYYTLKATNAGGDSPASNEASATPLAAPTAPTHLAAQAGSAQIALSWNAVANATSYQVFRSTTSNSFGTMPTQTVSTPSYMDTGVTNGTTYYYVVRAVGVGGTSDPSSQVFATPLAAPAAPTNLSATPGDATVTLSWSPSANATSYQVFRSTTAGTYSSTALTVLNGATTYSDTGLSNGTTYYYIVKAVNVGGSSQASVQVSATPVAAPVAPTGLSATPGNAQIVLSWNAATGATGYKLFRSTTGGTYTATPLVILGSVTTYTDTTPSNGTTYFYTVKATNAGGDSPASNEASATPLAVPAVPANLTAQAGNAQVALSWGGVVNATSYQVFRSLTAGNFAAAPTQTVSGTSYTDTGLSNGTTYFYTVKAVGIGGTSPASNQASATPLAAPVAPLVAAQAGNAQITLSWGSVANATSYQVFRSMTSNTFDALPTQTVSGTSYTDTGLANGTTYYYVVKAVGVGGTSAASNQVSATPLAAPVAPANLSATPGDTSVALSWSASANATSYKLFRSTTLGNYGATPLATVTGTSYPDTNVVNGTTYYYTVKATGIGGDSPASSEVSATPIAPPSAPTGLSATPGNAQVTLSWTASTGASSYSVLHALAAGGPFSSVATNQTGTTYSDTGLSNGTTYFYQVIAVNGSGQSGNSNTASATPQAAPDAPTGLSASAGDAQVALSWTASTNATGYKVFRATGAGGYGTAPLATVTGTSYSDTSAINGTTYYYSVKATGIGGDSPFSNEVSALPVAPPAPAAPTGLRASVYSNQISLSWTAPAGATSYIVRRATASAGPYSSLPATVTGTYYNDSGLPFSTTYYYRVIAVNNGGQSPESATVSATTLAPPPALSGVTATSGTGQVALTWNALPYNPGNNTSYNVGRSTTPGGPYTLVANNVYYANYTNTGLSNGTTYYYVVSATNAAGTGPNSAEMSATPLAVPTLSAVGAKARVDLSWNAVAGATGYQVFRSTNSGTYTYTSPLTTTTTQTTYSDSGLTTDTQRYYVVRATVASGSSNSSAQVSTRPLVPVALDLPLASTTGQGVTISWTVNKFAGFASYMIYRGTQTGVTPVNGTLVTTITTQATTTFFDPAPQATSTGSSYFYIVVVNATSGESVVSLERSVTLSTSDLQLHLSASPGDGQTSLEWGYGTATSPQGITGWGIKRATTSGGTYTPLTPSPALGASASTYTDMGLTNGTTYFYRVYPILSNGNGPDSNEASVVPGRAIPSGDLVLSGAAMNTQTRLWWNASSRASQYILFRRVGVGNWSQLATIDLTDNPSYNDAGLQNGTIYSYRVRAINETGNSTDSNIVSLVPSPSVPLAPAAPTFGTVTSSTIVVNAPALPYGATSISVYMGLSSDPTQIQTPVATGLTSSSTFTVSGLMPSQSYYFRASAVNTFGSTNSPTASAYTSSLPAGSPVTLGAPVIASVTYGVVDSTTSPPKKGHIISVYGSVPYGTSPSLYVQWKLQGDDDSVYSQTGHDIAMNYAGGSTRAVSVQPLMGSTTYVFRIRCVDSSTTPATTTYSPTSTATTLIDPPAAPPAPDIPSATLADHSLVVNVPPLPSGATGLTLYWGHSLRFDSSTGAVIGGYNGTPGSSVVPSGATTFTVSGLSGAQSLQFLWMASNLTGGTPGPTTTVTTQGAGLAAPDPPAFLNLATDSVEVIVPANVQDYGSSSSVRLLLQGKVTGSDDTTYQTLLFGPGNPGASYRTTSTSGTSAITPHPEVGPMDLQRRLLVTNLTPGQSYTFRFVSYLYSLPSTTQVNGAPNTVTMSSETLTWSSGSPISCSGIRYPWDGLTAKSGGVYHLNSYGAIDWDVLTHSVAGFSWNQAVSSPCLYGWGADGGSFPEGIKGPNVIWQAPVVSVPTDVTLSLQVSDSNTDAAHVSVGRRETGVRADAPILAVDRPLQFQVTVHVNP